MKIKSLLLGSAAALVAVSGARAADAVVIPEPEAVEYVRVCDAAGAGYFYIPGGETCLKIGGYVRYEIGVGRDYNFVNNGAGNEPWDGSAAGGYTNYGWAQNARGQLVVESWSDTELGPLTSKIAIQGNSNAGRNAVIDEVGMSLAGLYMGVSDNAFDGGINGEHDSLGGAKTTRIAYTFDNGTFSATLSLDDDGDNFVRNNTASARTPNFQPNVSLNAGGDFGVVDARIYAAFDNNTNNYAVKGVIGADVGANGKFQVAGYYTDGVTYVFGPQTIHARNVRGGAGNLWASDLGTWAEYSLAASYMHQVTSKFGVTLGGQYWWNFQHADRNFNTGLATVADIDAWRIGTVFDYEVVEGFDVKLAVNYTRVDNSTPANPGGWDGTAGQNLNFVSGFLRFQRSF